MLKLILIRALALILELDQPSPLRSDARNCQLEHIMALVIHSFTHTNSNKL